MRLPPPPRTTPAVGTAERFILRTSAHCYTFVAAICPSSSAYSQAYRYRGMLSGYRYRGMLSDIGPWFRVYVGPCFQGALQSAVCVKYPVSHLEGIISQVASNGIPSNSDKPFAGMGSLQSRPFGSEDACLRMAAVLRRVSPVSRISDGGGLRLFAGLLWWRHCGRLLH